MNNTKKKTNQPKPVINLFCIVVACIGIIIFFQNNRHSNRAIDMSDVKKYETFSIAFNEIRDGDTAELVQKRLGSPDEINEFDRKEKDVVTELPQQIWTYNVEYSTFSIWFEPDGLKNWEDPMKWHVVTKGFNK